MAQDPFFDDVYVDDDQLIHRVNVYRMNATGQDEAGALTLGQTENPPQLVLSNLACLVGDLNAQEQEMFSRKDITATHSVYFKRPVLLQNDLLQWGSRLLRIEAFSDQLGQGVVLVAICFEHK